jgi:hypothetical protein
LQQRARNFGILGNIECGDALFIASSADRAMFPISRTARGERAASRGTLRQQRLARQHMQVGSNVPAAQHPPRHGKTPIQLSAASHPDSLVSPAVAPSECALNDCSSIAREAADA